MAKLFPPLIEGAIPAFYPEENGIVKITIPFSMNRAVGSVQVKGFALKAKTVQSTTYLFTYTQEDKNKFNMEDSCYVEFEVDSADMEKLKRGQFYKFQLAYIDQQGVIGYYSTVGVGKYTTKPEIIISGLEHGIINMHNYEYMGVYSQKNGDITERVYSYQFDAYDSKGNLIATSGEQLHNSSNDIEMYESYDKFILAQDLEIDKNYYIKYTVNTNNGLTISSPRYRIMQKISIDPEIKASLSVSLNFENGYVNVDLKGDKDDEGMETPATGAFLLTRACAENNYGVWEEISRFKLAAQTPSRWLWRDFTVEQGKTYIYALQQYNDKGLYSNKILSNELYVDFEDAFLFDGEKQLKIKYNPKMSSFKTNLLETKVNTIGAKHPFIFRNGHVNYKEFPISGLISYLMDEENLFMNEEDYMLQEKTTNLISSNLASERIFKMKVLEWLSDGEPKLFRSPTEGNYIVRLMNSSLTPNDTLGRMLHTFNCTAYEIADFTYQNLNAFNFIQLKDPEVATLRFETIDFKDIVKLDEPNDQGYIQLNKHPITTIRLTDLYPGDTIQVWPTDYENDIIEIKIGVTGSYYIDLGMEIKKLMIPSDLFKINTIVTEKKTSGKNVYTKTDEETGKTLYYIQTIQPLRPNASMTYSFYSIAQNQFDKIDYVQVSEVPTRQFIGEHNILQELEQVPYWNKGYYKDNPKVDILEFYVVNAFKRSVEKAQYNEATGIYSSLDGQPLNVDLFTLYAIGKWIDVNDETDWEPEYKNNPFDTSDYFRPGYPNRKYKIDYYMDPFNDKRIEVADYDPSIYINGAQNYLRETVDFTMSRPGKLTSLSSGNGAIIEVAYQVRTIDYSIEDDDNWNVKLKKNNYLDLYTNLDNLLSENNLKTINWEDETEVNNLYKQEQAYRIAIKKAYNDYICTLIDDQEAERVAEGLL